MWSHLFNRINSKALHQLYFFTQNIINSSSSPNKSLLPAAPLTKTLFTMNSSFLITTPERPQDKFTTLLKLSVSSVGSITCLPCCSLSIYNRLPRLSSNKKQWISSSRVKKISWTWVMVRDISLLEDVSVVFQKSGKKPGRPVRLSCMINSTLLIW